MMMKSMLMALAYLQLKAKNLFRDEDGAVDIVAIVVLVGVAVLLAIVFKNQLGQLIETLLSTITGKATQVVTTEY